MSEESGVHARKQAFLSSLGLELGQNENYEYWATYLVGEKDYPAEYTLGAFRHLLNRGFTQEQIQNAITQAQDYGGFIVSLSKGPVNYGYVPEYFADVSYTNNERIDISRIIGLKPLGKV